MADYTTQEILERTKIHILDRPSEDTFISVLLLELCSRLALEVQQLRQVIISENMPFRFDENYEKLASYPKVIGAGGE